jgi:serine/threonine protein kinase
MKTEDNDSEGSLSHSGQLDDPRVVEALDEYLAVLEAGQKPNRQEFLSRHAAIADALAECLEGIEMLHQSTAPAKASLGGVAGWQEGTPLGDYRLVREIGRGGMGIVYEAEQLSLSRRIALKVLPFALTLDPRQLQRFKNEARAAAQLHHQHIVPVYAVGSERGVHFYAMQYIEGQSLAEVIRDLRRSRSEEGGVRSEEEELSPRSRAPESTGSYVPQNEEAQRADISVRARSTGTKASALATSYSTDSTGFYRTVARIGIQAAEALEHAHEYGVIHRDIKPGNLLADAHGHLWITDFGLAQFQNEASLTQSGDLLGTLRYMSPEQASGQRMAIDHRTDIYSLGATLYEFLTLHPPFEGNNRQTLFHQILNDDPRPLRAHRKSIPVELETIVLKALAKSPSERYATAQELAEDLSRFLQDKPIRARPATATQRLCKWARRHPSVVWAALVLCLISVAGSLVSAEIIRRKTEDAYEREKKQAQLAREVVDRMFKLCEEELAGNPFFDGLRRRLLEDHFLVYYQELIDQQRDDPKAQVELSADRKRVQEILGNLASLQGGFQYQMLNDSDVVRELKTDGDQREQIRQLMADMRNRRSGLRNLSPEERLQRFLMDAEWMENEAKQILTQQQRERLHQIDLQSKGVRAFEEPEVIKVLHLNAAQREKIHAVQAQFFFASFGDCHPGPPDKRGGPPDKRGGPHKPPPDFPRGGRERGDAESLPDPITQIENQVLTEKQRQQWRELTGKPFKGIGRHPPGPHGHPPPP